METTPRSHCVYGEQKVGSGAQGIWRLGLGRWLALLLQLLLLLIHLQIPLDSDQDDEDFL